MRAPYTGKRSESPHHEHYDSLFWEMLLHNDIIPKESDLYIHSKDGDFSSEKSFDDLKNEWVVLNKGNLEKYSETAQPEVIQNPSEQSQEFLDSQNTNLLGTPAEIEPAHISLQRKLASALDRVEIHLDNGRISNARNIFFQAKGILYNARNILWHDTLQYYKNRMDRIQNRLSSGSDYDFSDLQF